MAPKERPINADLPAAKPGGKPAAEAKTPASAKPMPRPQRRRRPIPGALKAIAGLFALAIVFIVAAIVGGGSGGSENGETPAPVSEAPSAHAEAPAAQTPEELGYPAFATANTTRVGGSDPASNAAGIALATYPSTEPSQRPTAVTLVDADDWRGAIAASVLMAAPVGAPVLVSEADGVPEPTAQALDALDPQGGKATKGARAFAIGAASLPDGLEARRIGGNGGIEAAGAIATLREKLVGGPPQHFVIAPAAQPAFAMPAAAWAARSGDPVLFANQGKLPAATATALKRHPHVPVYVLGPSSAISSNVVREVGKIADRVRRVSGEDPVTNAIELARYADGDFGWNINDPGHGFVIASSDSPLDAAAAAPLSASGTWGPLLLTDSADTLPDALRGYLLDVKPGYTTDPTRAFYNHVWVIGDQDAIDVSEQAEIDELAELAKIGGEG
ncbi:MAG TPA: cell wall-binding repeat-containing protein [Solirubrobacterales bacterium]|nr:cell wall-binding repeat-containing protein [Solirubrobacterales bacterium]